MVDVPIRLGSAPDLRAIGGKRWGSCCVMLALAIGACAPKPAAPADASVEAATALRTDVPIAVTGLGRAAGYYTASVRAQTTGPIVALSFVEGQTVQAGQKLAQIDPRPLQAQLAQDEAAVARSKAALAGAQDLLHRTEPLVAQGLASAQQVEAYRTQVAQLAAGLAGDRALVMRDRLTLGYATVRAPIAGVTGVRTTDPGNLVSPTDPNGIVTIVQVQPIAVLFTIAQGQLPAIQAARLKSGKAALAVDALAPGDKSILDRGHLTVINNRIDDGSGTIQLKAVFPNAARRIWPGQQVLARLVLGASPQAITIPTGAIQRSPSGTFLWLVDGDGKVRMQTVAIGAAIGDRTVVTSGLSGGERVVTDGQFGLSTGRRVAVTAATANSAPVRSDDPNRLGLAL